MKKASKAKVVSWQMPLLDRKTWKSFFLALTSPMKSVGSSALQTTSWMQLALIQYPQILTLWRHPAHPTMHKETSWTECLLSFVDGAEEPSWIEAVVGQGNSALFMVA